jgi:hypothetical protein
MGHYKIVNDEEPIRLFKSSFLEFFTHISPVTVVAIWLPFILYLLIAEIVRGIGRGTACGTYRRHS